MSPSRRVARKLKQGLVAMVTRWHSVLNCSEHCSWVPATLVGLWLLGCSGSDSEEYRENSPPEEDVSSCEQSLGHLQEWTERPPIDTQQVAVMLSVCEAEHVFSDVVVHSGSRVSDG